VETSIGHDQLTPKILNDKKALATSSSFQAGLGEEVDHRFFKINKTAPGTPTHWSPTVRDARNEKMPKTLSAPWLEPGKRKARSKLPLSRAAG
jgi:hypothetical protein